MCKCVTRTDWPVELKISTCPISTTSIGMDWPFWHAWQPLAWLMKPKECVCVHACVCVCLVRAAVAAVHVRDNMKKREMRRAAVSAHLSDPVSRVIAPS